MRRKIVSIWLVIIILFSNSGWAFSLHFCKERLASISIESIYTSENQDACVSLSTDCCSDTDIHDKCCESDFFESSSSDSNIVTKVFQWQLIPFIVEKIQFAFDYLTASKSKKKIVGFYIDSNAPPLYCLYCQLVFYA